MANPARNKGLRPQTSAFRPTTQPRKKKILKKILLHIQEQFDLFNNRLPMRYQTTLKNRIV